MKNSHYIIYNKAVLHVASPNNETIEFRLYDEIVKLTGEGVINLANLIISNTLEPIEKQDLISIIIKEYTPESVHRIFNYFIDKGILINYEDQFQMLTESEIQDLYHLHYRKKQNPIRKSYHFKIVTSDDLFNIINASTDIEVIHQDDFSLDINQPNYIFITNKWDKKIQSLYSKMISVSKVMPIFIINDDILIGPIYKSNSSACLNCTYRRYITNNTHSYFYDDRVISTFNPRKSVIALYTAIDEFMKIENGIHSDLITNALVISEATPISTSNFVFKSPDCEVCYG